MFAKEYGWTAEYCMSLPFLKQHLYIDRLIARNVAEANAIEEARKRAGSNGGSGSSSSSSSGSSSSWDDFADAPLINGKDVARDFF